MSKRRRQSELPRSASSIDRFLSWSDSYRKVSKWFLQLDLERELDDNAGLVQLRDFLPLRVAQGALDILKQVPEDPAATPGLEQLFRLFHLLLPEELNSFSIARYTQGHHIAAHDDRAYTNVQMEDGQVVECSRTIAVIYYLTKDWKEEYGGLLKDFVSDKVFIPEFNSVIAFRVPRYHQVTPMRTSLPRYSVFGWFLQPGRLYDLYQGGTAATSVAATEHKGKCVFESVSASGSADAMPSDEKNAKRLKSQMLPIASPHALSTLLASKSIAESQQRFARLA